MPKATGAQAGHMQQTVQQAQTGKGSCNKKRNMTVAQALEQYHPMGLTEDWADKMAGQAFNSKNQRTTFEHYMQVRCG